MYLDFIFDCIKVGFLLGIGLIIPITITFLLAWWIGLKLMS
jgi:hypothetical protein